MNNVGKKKQIIIAVLLCCVLVLSCCLIPLIKGYKKSYAQSNVVYTVEEVEQSSKLFDYYEETVTDTYSRITAFKNIKGDEVSGIENVNIQQEETLRTAYDVEYNYDAEMIYLTISLFDEDDNFVSAQCMEAYPIVMDNGEVDALFEIDGKNVYLSEILNGSNENCFFFSIAMSLLAAKIVAAAIVVAKVAAVVTAVVAIGYTTYKVAEITKAKIQERERTAARQKNKSNPKVYYPAARKSGKLLIAASPIGLIAASKAIVNGIDFWSPFNYTAKQLAITASGGYVGPEIDSRKPGYYYHYHLLGRVGGHSFYGTPSGGQY